jgi:hypothetical protein
VAFDPGILFQAAGVLAATAGAIAVAFHLFGLGYDHYRRAWPLAGVSAASFLVALALAILRGPGTLGERLHAPEERPEAFFLGVLVVAATALAANAVSWQRLADRGLVGAPDPRHPLVLTLAIGLGLVALVGFEVVRFPPTEDVAAAGPGPSAVVATACWILLAGLALLLAAAAAAHAFTGRAEWADVALPWTRGALLAGWMGLAMRAIGEGSWSGTTEDVLRLSAVLSLVPLVHGLIYYRKRRIMRTLTPFFGALVFPAALLAACAAWSGPGLATPAPQYLAVTLLSATVAPLAFLARRTAAGHGLRRWMGALAAGLGLGAAAVAFGRPDLLAVVLPVPVPYATFLAGALVVAGLASFAWALSDRGPRPPMDEAFLDRWIQMGPLVHVGMILFAAGFGLFALMGATRGAGAASDLGLFLAWPVLLVMGLALSNQLLGRAASLVSLAVAAALSLLAWPLAGPHYFLWPAAAFALLGALLKIIHVSDSDETPGPLRVGGAILVLGGIATLAVWTDPALFSAAFTRWHLPAALAPLGLALALLAVAGGISALRRRHVGLALAGAVGLALGLAWIAPVALAVLAIFVRRRGDFESSGGRPYGLSREFRKTGVYLIHVAVALLALGAAGGRLAWAGTWMGATGLIVVLAAGGAAIGPERKGPGGTGARTAK